MLRYLLDTNICIDVIKRRPQELLETFNRHAGQMAISAISFSELLHGVEKSAAPARNLAAVENFCSRLDLLAYGPKASLHCGQMRASLERSGTTIGVNDLHIAAHARSEGLTLVSNNLGEFPLGRHHQRAPTQLVGGTGNGGIGAAGTAVEQQMDKPAAAAGQQLSGNHPAAQPRAQTSGFVPGTSRPKQTRHRSRGRAALPATPTPAPERRTAVVDRSASSAQPGSTRAVAPEAKALWTGCQKLT